MVYRSSMSAAKSLFLQKYDPVSSVHDSDFIKNEQLAWVYATNGL